MTEKSREINVDGNPLVAEKGAPTATAFRSAAVVASSSSSSLSNAKRTPPRNEQIRYALYQGHISLLLAFWRLFGFCCQMGVRLV